MANTETQKPELAGVIGYFDDTHSLLEATAKVRDSQFKNFDVYTPFPVHGLEHAQGLKRSWLPFVTFGAGLAGFCLAFTLQYWTSAVDWPIIVGGKPMNSWPAFVPVMFELTVLLAGLFTVGAMFFANGLPNVTKKAFDPRLTRDRFAIVIEAPAAQKAAFQLFEGEEEEVAPVAAPAFSESDVAAFLSKLGAKDVRSVYNEGWF